MEIDKPHGLDHACCWRCYYLRKYLHGFICTTHKQDIEPNWYCAKFTTDEPTCRCGEPVSHKDTNTCMACAIDKSYKKARDDG